MKIFWLTTKYCKEFGFDLFYDVQPEFYEKVFATNASLQNILLKITFAA